MNQMKITCKAELVNDGFVRNSVASFVMSKNPTIDEIVEIKTMVSEAFTNAIIHGYNGETDREVSIEATLNEDTLRLIIEDQGCGIEDIKQASTPLFSTKPGDEHAGMGLSIIEALSDEFEIQSSKQQGTKLTITKTLKKKHGQ
ncbi:anti-sigma F factor [Beduini massiliensis]|uniref:anti-sigma F factor n=1 Tax=Beduini massiliensis TaxID=1585974 RepID=UPI00059AAC5C|nr:anti-sigma F factor [Beduini massiliensis]